MSFELKPGEPVPDQIRRVVAEQMADAAGQLRATDAVKRDKNIHEARKNIKKVRGILRLVQPQLGDLFAAENVRLRNAGRGLSRFRDAGAIIETFDELRVKHRDDLGNHTLASIRRALLARKREAEQKAGIKPLLDRISSTLQKSEKRVERWPLDGDGFKPLESGLHKTFRNCRRALARARKYPTPENFHEWRKKVKQHWYHVRLLADPANQELQDYEKKLKHLETWLGEEHNVVVLRELVLAKPAEFGKDTEVKFFLGLLDKYQAELRHHAIEAGKEIYAEKPGAFVKRIKAAWKAREKEPDTPVSDKADSSLAS